MVVGGRREASLLRADLILVGSCGIGQRAAFVSIVDNVESLVQGGAGIPLYVKATCDDAVVGFEAWGVTERSGLWGTNLKMDGSVPDDLNAFGVIGQPDRFSRDFLAGRYEKDLRWSRHRSVGFTFGDDGV